MIAVLDYGAGNLCSVANTLDALEVPFQLARTAETLTRASKIILPGVGHFGQMMRALDAMNVRGALIDSLQSGVPFLGICLGMQALFEKSAEAPEVGGLAIFPGAVERFPPDFRVPHMGWNQVRPKPHSRLFRGLPSEPWFYFAHSYFVPEVSMSAASCTYSVPYTAALEHQNIFGVQFHPEKSSSAGQSVVRSFVEI